MNSETKLFIGILASTVAIIIAAISFFSQPVKPIAKETLVGANPVATGSASAKTWLVEFSDFQCPACLAYEPTVEELMKTYPQDLYFVYRNFPLAQHPFAVPAAQAFLAAGQQGKYWEMHNRLFANQDSFSDATWATLAKELALDEEKFLEDMKSKAINDVITTDQTYGTAIGINSTPTFYLNGLKLTLDSPEDLKKEVEKALKI